MSNNEFNDVPREHKRIQTCLYHPNTEQERIALRTWLRRRSDGESPRDIISYALASVADTSQPSRIDASTGEWLLGAIREENEHMIGQIRDMLKTLRVMANADGMVSVNDVEQYVSEFERNARDSVGNRRNSIDL